MRAFLVLGLSWPLWALGMNSGEGFPLMGVHVERNDDGPPQQHVFPPMAFEGFHHFLPHNNNDTHIEDEPSLAFLEDIRPRMLMGAERLAARNYFVPFNLDPILADHLVESVETWLMRNGGALIDAQRRILLRYLGIFQLHDLAFAMDRVAACSEARGGDEVVSLFTALFEYGIVRIHPDYLGHYLMRAQQGIQEGIPAGEVYWMLMYQFDGLSEDDAFRAYRYQQERMLANPGLDLWDAYCLGFFNAFFVRGEVATNALRWVHAYRAGGMFNSNAMVYALFLCQGIGEASVVGLVQEYYRLLELGLGLSPAHCYMQALYGVHGFEFHEAAAAACEFVSLMNAHAMNFYDAFFHAFYQTHGFPLFFIHRATAWALDYLGRGVDVFRAAWYGAFRTMEVAEPWLENCFQMFLSASQQFRWSAWPSFARVMMAFNGARDLNQGMRDLQAYENSELLYGRLEALLYVTFKERYNLQGSELTRSVRQYLGEMSTVIRVD